MEMLKTLVLGWVACASLFSAGLNVYDKILAKLGGKRISEKSLHLADAVGGSLGGLVARCLIRHKTAKPAFLVPSVAILVVQGAMVAVAASYAAR